MKIRNLICLLGLLWTPMGLAQSENDFATAYQKSPMDGELIWFEGGGKRHFAIYKEETSGFERGVVILLHDQNEHPDWPAAIAALRRDLPDYGWSTLSLALPWFKQPLAESNHQAVIAEALSRLQAAIGYIKRNPERRVTLIGHGLGALIALRYSQTHQDDIHSLVTISLPALPPPQPSALDGSRALRQLQLPLLDIYAQQDNFEVTSTSKRRRDAARKGHNAHYRQLQLPGADHHFQGHEALLNKRIRSWLIATHVDFNKEGQFLNGKMVPMTPEDQQREAKRLAEKRRMEEEKAAKKMNKTRRPPAMDANMAEDKPAMNAMPAATPETTETTMGIEPAPTNMDDNTAPPKPESPPADPRGPNGLF